MPITGAVSRQGKSESREGKGIEVWDLGGEVEGFRLGAFRGLF